MENNKKGLRRIGAATRYSCKGVKAAWTFEPAFRQEIILLVVMTPFALWLANGFAEFFILVGAVVLVVVAELLNSAIETITDRISIEHHYLSGRAKDLGSAAVFIAILQMLLIWIIKICMLFMS